MIEALSLALQSEFLEHFFWAATIIISGIAIAHVVIKKRDSKSAIAWTGLILFSPILGALLYFFFGINRVERKANRRASHTPAPKARCQPPDKQAIPKIVSDYSGINQTARSLGSFPLIEHYSAKILYGGDQAYAEIQKEMAKAKRSISVLSYIFRVDSVGIGLLEELERAKSRGVEVRILVDDVGTLGDTLKLVWQFKKRRLKGKIFLPVLFHTFFSNLRNHRKLIIIDGVTAYTGSMNIGAENTSLAKKSKRTQDLQVRLTGPVVEQLQTVFADDFAFASREVLSGEAWFPIQPRHEVSTKESSMIRTLHSGPTLEDERIPWIFQSAINAAKHSVRIMTPYFIPDQPTVATLCAAALRGVQVEVFFPENSDVFYMNWAIQGNLRDMLEKGVRFYKIPGDFEHTKLLLIDSTYSVMGSPNWDVRSFRLNFELAVEFYDREIAKELSAYLDAKQKHSTEYTLQQYFQRPLPVKIRDGLARTLSPYI